MFSLNDLVTPLTREQVQASIYDVLAIVGVNTTTWKPGAVVRTMIAATSIVISAFSSLTAQIARSGFLELAEGDWLTLVARHVYAVERELATFAEGEITLVNAGGGSFTLDPDDLVVSNPTTGKSYRNTLPFTLGALATITIPIVAIEAGSASTSSPNTITEVETTLLGVTCTNAAAVVGRDAEQDPALRARCSEKLGALSPNGPWDAYSYAARNAKRPDGTSIGVTRVRISKDGFGNVTVYCATASGAVTGTVIDPDTDLGIVDLEIQKKAAPLAVTATAVSATPLSIPITYSVWMTNTSGLQPAQIEAQIAAKLTSFMASQPIGGQVIGADPGKVFADAIRTTIGSARPEIFHVVVTAPAADVVLALNQVPVLGTVTATAINQLPPTEGGF
jgi:uncharacterized phage protein gp47/JayE